MLSDHFNLLLDVNLNELTPGLRWTENNHHEEEKEGKAKEGGRDRRVILQYHLSGRGLSKFSKGAVIQREMGCEVCFCNLISIISSVIHFPPQLIY